MKTLAQMDPAWADRPSAWRKQFSGLLSFDCVVLAIFDPAQPVPNTFLLADRLQAGVVEDWCSRGFKNDALLRDVIRHSVPVTDKAKGLLTGHAVAATLPACYERNTVWYLAFSRKNKPFDDVERRIATTMLRILAARFEFPTEADFGQVLVKDDHQLLHADPIMCLRFVQDNDLIQELANVLPAVIAQRWPQLADYQTHSLFLSLSGQPTWVRLRRGRSDHVTDPYWYLELRPLETGDPPTVGLVDDERVALAMGYIADHFDEAPSLTDIAQQVSTSPFHFHRLFSRQAAISPKHFLLRIQLLNAKQLLRSTSLSIADVAQNAGFASHGHFTTTFNRMVGCNPSSYREQF
jgi:AraC-like DNA-binding protein